MKDGLYKMKFTTPLGSGSGVVVKAGDNLFGGDSAFAWVGGVAGDTDNVTATARVSRHDSSLASVFGPLNDFQVNLAGAFTGDAGVLHGTTPSAPGIGLKLDLTLLKAA